MVSSRAIWSAAIVLSLMAHAGPAAILTLSPEPEPEAAQTAGGVVAEVAMLGNNAFETIEAGRPDETERPDEIQPEILEPVPPELADIMPDALVLQQVMPVERAEVPEADAIVPQASEGSELQDVAVESAAVPVPGIKPKLTEKPPAAARPLHAEVKRQQEKVERKTGKKAGEKGESVQATSKGHADGATDVKTASLGGQAKGNASAAGNAAVENYPGKVRNKINRAKRRVAGTGVGTVTVSFTISASGQATGIKISASSGQPELDQAAMEAVRRAAPFPDIPEESGRSSWSFRVPIAFKR